MYSTPPRFQNAIDTQAYSPIVTKFNDDTSEFISHFKGREKSYEYVNHKIRSNDDVKSYELPSIGRSPYSYSKLEKEYDYSLKVDSPLSKTIATSQLLLASPLRSDEGVEQSARLKTNLFASRSPRSPIASMAFGNSTTKSPFHSSQISVSSPLKSYSLPEEKSYKASNLSSSSRLYEQQSSDKRDLFKNASSQILRSPLNQYTQERHDRESDRNNSKSYKTTENPSNNNFKFTAPNSSTYNPMNYSDTNEESKTEKYNFQMPIQKLAVSVKPEVMYQSETVSNKISVISEDQLSEESPLPTVDQYDQSSDSFVEMKKTKEWIESAFTHTEDLDAMIKHETKDINQQNSENISRSTQKIGSTISKTNNFTFDKVPSVNQTNSTEKTQESLAVTKDASSMKEFDLFQDSISQIEGYNDTVLSGKIDYSRALDTTTTKNRRGPCLIPGYETPYNIDRHTTRCSTSVLSTHLFICGKDKISNSYPSRMEFFKHGYEAFWKRETSPEERRMIVRWMRDPSFQIDKEGAKSLYSLIQRSPRAESSFNVYLLVDSDPTPEKIELSLKQGLCVASWHPDSLSRRLEKSSNGKVFVNVKISHGEPYLWLTNELIQQADDRHIYGINHVDTQRTFLFWAGLRQLRVKSVKDQCLCAFQRSDRKSEFRVSIPIAFAELR